MTMVVGLFDTLVTAQHAIANLIDAGYSRGGISILIRKGSGSDAAPACSAVADETAWHHACHASEVDAPAGVVAGGPLARALHATPDADCEASMTRVLSAAGMAPAAASYFARAVRAGNILVSVNCEDSLVRDARDILDDHASGVTARRGAEHEARARHERQVGSGT